jgi:dTDP-4-amino-4,6-dideoxygalactose transaminase
MLQRLDERLKAHRRVADTYLSRLRDFDGIVLPALRAGVQPNWWMFTVAVERRADFMKKLHARNIHAATPHNRNDRLSCFPADGSGELPGLNHFADHYVCLPIGPWVSLEDAERVCAAIGGGW